MQMIENGKLHVMINETGAQLWSIRGKTEYLWQGDPTIWAGRSPTIFPYVARLNGGKYTVDGELYRLPNHGFGSYLPYAVVEHDATSVVLELMASKLTHALYPWDFAFRVRYALAGNRLNITFVVENTGDRTMFFGLGGHPGFNVPLEAGLEFEDYALQFETPCAPEKIRFTDDCIITGDTELYPLENGTTIHLTHNLFDHDAIVLQGTAKAVTLQSTKGSRGVRVSFPQMPYFGFWHMPHVAAPYVCIEPWSSLPAKKGQITEFVNHPDLISLPSGQTYRNSWSIEIFE